MSLLLVHTEPRPAPQDRAEAEADDDLSKVKALTAKLKLETRRPSYAEWQEKLAREPWKMGAEGEEALAVPPPAELTATTDTKQSIALTTICGFAGIGDALDWLREELRQMQSLDHQLARRLICLRREIHRLKVEQACHQHKEMLDDVTYDLEVCEEESDLLCDIPLKAAFHLSTPLKHIGVTKMNINSRRFSLS
uniref:Family with sequence similarity 167 member B n=1 Tax=Callorhinchus milii TaxID=7868 RepID=A0A4W3JEB5_CALMI